MAETLPLAADAAGELTFPSEAYAIVVLAHGHGAGREVIRDALLRARLATLRIDVQPVYPGDAAGPSVRRITEQLVSAARWVAVRPDLASMPVGVFGSEIAGGAALAAAAGRPDVFRALVIRNSRQHLAGSVLKEVRAATLLIVDGHDEASVSMNQETMTRVRGIAELEILPELPDSNDAETVAHLARRWFARFLA